MNVQEVSYELLHKYNVPGPRYTSYPTAPNFTADFTGRDYERAIEESNAAAAPLSLYFHLPFCERLCYFCGCTVVITGKNHKPEDIYLGALKREIEWLAGRIDRRRPVLQLHFGGGTPTYLSPAHMQELIEAIHHGFSFEADAEVGVEVDPRVTTPVHLEVLREGGFNRLSMGVQDFDPTVQKAINRIQPFEATRTLVEAARALGFYSVNMDLIYGLPYQVPDTFRRTIDQVLSIGPDRLAVYSYANVPWMKRHQRVLEPHLPTERQKFEIFKTALERFTGAGYEYIGMDHFAHPDDELARARFDRTLWRNFQGYTTKAGTDLFGLGMSAIGRIRSSFVQNHRELLPYETAVLADGPATVRGVRLTDDDRLRENVIQRLMCHGVVVKREIEDEFGIAFDSTFADAIGGLRDAEADGLVEVRAEEVRATPLGRVFLRNLAMPFDAYLPKTAEKPMFSRTL